MDILIKIIAFLFAIAVLVGVHEFGHYWVAKRLGVKVLRFSIGFGKPFLQYTSKSADQTEYALAAIPLGGYVKMLDEREGDVDEHERHRAFNNQPVWKRYLIVLAGPLVNFIFAIAAFAAMHMYGIDAMRPMIAAPEQNTPAHIAGLQAEDSIVAINGVRTVTMSDMRLTLLNEYLKSPQMELSVRSSNGDNKQTELDISSVPMLGDNPDYFDQTGIQPYRPKAALVIGQVLADQAAEKAGLKAGDALLSINGQAIAGYQDFTQRLQNSGETVIDLGIMRSNQPMTVKLTPKVKEQDGQRRVMIGVSLGQQYTAEQREKLFFVAQYSPIEALKNGVEDTYNLSLLTLKVMGRLLTGEASINNISGPVTIADVTGQSAMMGLSFFLKTLAIISLSLGVLNLLPIPMLDGGHLLFYTIEAIKGSPVSQQVEEYGMRIGMLLIGMLMVVALYNDTLRLMG